MSIGYVLAQFPGVSETFIVGEIHEVVRQGDDVSILSLAPRSHREDVSPDHRELRQRTTYVPGGVKGALQLLGAMAVTALTHPVCFARTLLVALRGCAHQRRRADLVHLGQACYLRQAMPGDVQRLHAHYAHSPATTAMMLSNLTGLQFSFTGHARDMFELADRSTLRRNAATAAAVVAISEHGRRYLSGALGRNTEITLIRNGIDLSAFTFRTTPPSGVPVILAVSRLVEKKGLDTLIEACALLVRRGRECRCEIVGDGPLRDQLDQQIRRLGLGDVVSLAGSHDVSGVMAAYRRATVVALPCRRDRAGDQDGLPVSLVEAMAVGVPVISTPISGIPELIEPEVSGLLVPPDQPAELADSIDRVLSDDVLRRRLAANARGVAEAYDRVFWVHRLRGVFNGQPAMETVS